MPDRAMVCPAMTGDTWLARARKRFLSGEPVGPGRVRDTILASWRRCRAWNVAPDRIRPSCVCDPGLDTPLARSALPVLRRLHDTLEGQPVSVTLADARGVLLSRLTSDDNLERHLDGVRLLPGFSYAEKFAGTNGIGTALECGRAAHVFGHEHYAEHLEDLACAAAPARDPISGKIIGAVGLTCWRKDAGPLLIALADSTAGQIGQALLHDASGWEIQLLREYLRARQHNRGLVFALGDDMVMMSQHARDLLEPGDQGAVLGHAAEALAAGRRGPLDVDLPSGASASLSCRSVGGKGQRGRAGGVAHVKLARAWAGSCLAWQAPARCGHAGAIRRMRLIAAASGSQ
jgi:sigma-54 dependent transcriptional regulator, acetoin dehydrogenase operon transcriptional activator AcoR